MKFIDDAQLLHLSNELQEVNVGNIILTGKVEAYSCRSCHLDKQLIKQLDAHYSSNNLTASPLGLLSEKSTRQLLCQLISTMNSCFPDYDFSQISPEHFTVEANAEPVVTTINSQLINRVELVKPGFRNRFWEVLDDCVDLQNCYVYSFNPDETEDVYDDDKIWSFNYFFFNRKMKKMVFLTGCAMSELHSSLDDESMAEAMFDAGEEQTSYEPVPVQAFLVDREDSMPELTL